MNDITERLQAEIIAAIVNSSIDDKANIAILRIGEISDALLTVLANIIAMSPEASSSSTKVRKTVEDVSRRLQRRISGIRETGGITFTAVDLATLHKAPDAVH